MRTKGKKAPLRLTRIELENIRCFEHAIIDLSAARYPADWTLILGDNGVGKSTMLRTIALGLSSVQFPIQLPGGVGGPWIRRGAKQGQIKVTFETGETSVVEIKPGATSEWYGLPGANGTRRPPWERIFFCGYGAGRSVLGDRSFSRYSFRDAVATLFNDDARLQNPELVLRRLASAEVDARVILDWIDRILMLPPGSTRLETTGLEINGPWGKSPVADLGDGYRATLTWMLDFLGWVMLWQHKMLQTGVRGIVLVDEIEQHLHPLWQRRILKLLREQFPEVQFIATTHAPLCVIGTTDFADDEVCLVHLRQDEEAVTVQSGLKPPRGMRADQVLTSYLFGLETTSDDQTKQEIGRLSELLSRSELSPAEQQEVKKLRRALNQKLGTEETDLERRVSIALGNANHDRLSSLPEPAPGTGKAAAGSILEEAAGMEVKRQIQELMKGL